MNSKMKVMVSYLGQVPYLQALDLQNELHQKRVNGEIPDVLLLLEHPSVITIGKSGNEQNILFPEKLLSQKGVEVVHIKRGGDVTYHGPGQIVGYPIFHILNYGKGVRDFVTNVEEAFIQLLATYYHLEARRDSQYTGVWVGNEKITAMGFEIRKYVSMHGFAFNVSTDLSYFTLINPCGIIGKGVTSLAKLTGSKMDMATVLNQVKKSFEAVFQLSFEEISKEEVYHLAGVRES
jgi:lipoyl(octanoyl) transferase